MTPTTRLSIAAVACGVLLLAGCSSDAAESDAAPSSDTGLALSDGSEAQSPGGGGFGGMAPGVSGEIAYVADGTAQVQDGSTQTAVTYDDTTTFSAQVEIALADIEAGTCVVAMLGDDDVATSISVTEAAEDGTCEAGFGGGMPGGEPPEGMEMPADGEMPALPDGAEAPADMPTAMPDMGDGERPEGGFGGFAPGVSGTVTAVASDAITVTDAEGTETTVPIAGTTTVTGTEEADASAVVVGKCLTAQGETDDAGTLAATEITVSTATDEGCVTGMGFGGGRMRGGQAPMDESTEG